MEAMKRRWLILLLLLGLSPFVSAQSQDSMMTSPPVRIVRSYDPHLPEWFRYSTDPLLLREDSSSTLLRYPKDSLERIPERTGIEFLDYPLWTLETPAPLEKPHRQWTLGAWPWSRAMLGWNGSGPALLASRSWHWLASVQGTAGDMSTVSDKFPRIRAFLPSFWMQSAPDSSGRQWTLETRLRSTKMSLGDSTSPYLHFWIRPQWEQDRESKRLEGLMTQNRVSVNGYAGGNGFSEWGINLAHRSSYRMDQGTLVGSASLVAALWSTDSLGGHRQVGTLGLSWEQAGLRQRWTLAPNLAFVNDDLQSRWVILPNFRWERTWGSPNTPSSLLEGGVTSSVQQASLYDWTTRFPTLFRVQSYGAAINRWEVYARWKHGLLKTWQGDHRLAFGRWNNWRFFEADNQEVFGVRSTHRASNYTWDWNTRWTRRTVGPNSLTIQGGVRGLIHEDGWVAMPGLQPTAYTGLQYQGAMGSSWFWRGDVMLYGLGSDLASSSPLRWPTSLDIALDKKTERSGVWSLVFRNRQGPLAFRWAEELYSGALIQLEWRRQL
ncbi:MAG: hypothetical protein ACKO17_05225 [Bacteroidota bacterium]